MQSAEEWLLKDGNKSDRIDARKLAELLRGNQLKPVYHGETGVRMLRELSRSYLTIVKDLSRVLAFAACSFQWRNLRHSEEPVGPIVIHGIEGYVSDDECNGDRQPSASMTAMSSAFIDLALART